MARGGCATTATDREHLEQGFGVQISGICLRGRQGKGNKLYYYEIPSAFTVYVVMYAPHPHRIYSGVPCFQAQIFDFCAVTLGEYYQTMFLVYFVGSNLHNYIPRYRFLTTITRFSSPLCLQWGGGAQSVHSVSGTGKLTGSEWSFLTPRANLHLANVPWL